VNIYFRHCFSDSFPSQTKLGGESGKDHRKGTFVTIRAVAETLVKQQE
jgi:hypothetical protein